MELLSPVSDEVPQQPLQDADTDGSSQECVILFLHVVHDAMQLMIWQNCCLHVGFGLRLGQAFDLVDGIGLCTVLGRALVWAYLKARRPRCVVVSPPCSRLMGIRRGRMPPGRFEDNNMMGKKYDYPSQCPCVNICIRTGGFLT